MMSAKKHICYFWELNLGELLCIFLGKEGRNGGAGISGM